MSTPRKLLSFLALFIFIGLARAGCPQHLKNERNPPGWDNSWGYASTGAYAADVAKRETNSAFVSFRPCSGAGCGPACCWHSNGFAFYINYTKNTVEERQEEATPICEVIINFNEDRRIYRVPIDQGYGKIYHAPANGFMGHKEGNWVDVNIECNAHIIQLFDMTGLPSQTAYCGGLPSPGPICNWEPTQFKRDIDGRSFGWWGAFYVDHRCNLGQLVEGGAEYNGTLVSDMQVDDFCLY